MEKTAIDAVASIAVFSKKIKMKRKISSPIKQKILLLLGAGVALGFAGTPRQYFRVLKTATRAWKSIDEDYLRRTVREFYRERLVSRVENSDGTTSIVLTEKGKLRILEFNIYQLKIEKPTKWDGKWRVVMFDIPEKMKSKRDVLREKLKDLKFLELQKSVFVHPYPCLEEINFLAEFYQIRKFVKCGELTQLTNEAELKIHFKLK
jgi:CRISPR/Cas system-associated endoribonuclease Cas2